MRRLFWLAVGLGAGAVGAVMTMRFARKQAEKVMKKDSAVGGRS